MMNEIPEHFETYAVNTVEVGLHLLIPEGWRLKTAESVGDWGNPYFEVEVEETSSPYRSIEGEGNSFARACADAGRKVRRL